jgi:peptide/nickel transport system substrate-binding protein
VKFSNGRELTADDVVETLNRLMDPKVAPWSAQLGMRNVVSRGPGQVTVTLTSPRTSFLAALAASYASILPMKEVAAGSFNPKKELLGTGPFKVAAHSPSESWTFERNPYYWRSGLPKVDKLIVRIMPDDAARTAALRNGTIDVTTFGNPDAIRLLKGQTNVKTVVQQTTDYYRIDVNAKSSLFTDDRLRQALALSIDRQKISNVALGGVGRPTAAAPVSFSGACDPNQVAFSRPDPQQARQLVAAAGATGKTVEIIAPAAVAMAAPIAQIIQQNLEAAGLKARIATLEIGDVMKRVYSGEAADFDLVISWFAGFGDPAMVFNYWNPTLGGFGKLWVKPDADLVRLVNKSSSTAPGAERTGLLRATCERIARHANIIPLVTKDAIVAYRPDKISANILPVDGYAVPLRNIAEFGAK